jgi:outer membrane protein
MLVAVDYYLNPGETLQPFVGFGAGTMFSRRNTDMNIYTFQQDAWHFAVRPEAGVMYKMSPGAYAYLALKYYHGFKSGDFNEAQSYMTINLGFIFIK